MNLADGHERRNALDTNCSFIVQAPAGSGKTALLTQRFLALLAVVNEPEEIIAITFTKKAASEMFERITETLKLALEPPPTEDYLLTSYQLAKNVLARDKERNWQLLQQPQRLRIQTIDALCLSLTKQMPLLSKSIPYCQITHNCKPYFEKAAVNCINTALNHPSYQTHIIRLIKHLGNHQNRLIELLTMMLTTRDQWLEHILGARELTAEYFEQTITQMQLDCITTINNLISPPTREALINIYHYRLGFVDETSIDGDEINNFQFWQTISTVFLKNDLKPRQRFSKREGFPASSHFKQSEEKESAKAIQQTLKEISLVFSENPLLIDTLALIRLMPQHAFSDEEFHVITALIHLLPLLVAEMHVIFGENSSVDFSEIALLANLALGDDNPTDLNLYLDYQIHHLLIDEFQDTSVQQFQLIEKITRTWQANENRTLFIVGDPMQSIYRFRQAEVGLFIKAQREGIGDIKLIPLRLQCNFRSNKDIIDWINHCSQAIFPKSSDIAKGAVNYSASIATNVGEGSIKAFATESKMDEAAKVIDIIKSHPNKKIAVLVRSRNQLVELMRLLRQSDVDYQGVELQKLAELAIIDHLYSLTKALVNRKDTLSWFNLLRSPLGGISYQGLMTVASHVVDNDMVKLASFMEKNTLALPEKEYQRACFVIKTISLYHRQLYRERLDKLVIKCWSALHGPRLITDDLEDDIETYWRLLEEHATIPINLKQLGTALNNTYASSNRHDANVNIMTIHKAKGLEFDVVILPSLEYTPSAIQSSLLQWLVVNEKTSNARLLLSPIAEHHDESSPLSALLKHIDKEKSHYENMRLLYVALTRAKESLYLLANEKKITSSTKTSMLAMLKDHIAFDTTDVSHNTLRKTNKSYHLPQTLYQAHVEHGDNIGLYAASAKKITSDNKRITGIFIHELLYYIAKYHIASFNQLNCHHWPYRLRELGLAANEIAEAIDTSKKALHKIFHSTEGRWIISRHFEEKNEYALRSKEGLFVLDRTFIEDDIRWIIDYKTTEQIDSHLEDYQKQLNHYAELFSLKEDYPCRLALYYPLLDKTIRWDYIRTGVTTPV